MLGIVYKADKDNPGTREQWVNLATKAQTLADLLKYKKPSIFGRAVLSNTLITPKLNYLIQTLEMPRDIRKQVQQIIRKFIFHGTTYTKIKNDLLMQPKLQGGIALQDIPTKIQTYKIQYMHDVINNPQQFPITTYYLAMPMRTHFPNINMPRFDHYGANILPRYYTQLLDTRTQHIDAFNNHTSTKLTYRILIDQKHPTIGPRQMQNVQHFNNIDFLEPFQNLHQKYITPHQKNITYRLLYNITPTSYYLFLNTNTIRPCPICNRYQETEYHLYYTCIKIQTAQILLQQSLISEQNNIPAHYEQNTKKAILLNIIPTTDRKLIRRHLEILAFYRQVIWSVRLDAKFRKKKFTQNAIKTRFKYWVDKVREKERERE